MSVRKITPMIVTDIEPGGADMREPIFRRARPEDLLVDETYQRNLSERSVRLIRKIVAHWDWRTFMPPVVVRTKDGLHVIDGQHTAIAAATHPKITEIPVMLVEAPEMAERAKAFLGRNRDRIMVTPTQLHYAAVVSGDEDAVTIDQVCKRAGIRILKNPPGAAGLFKANDTLAIATVSTLISRRGAMRARQVLQVIAAAKLTPIPATIIRAVDEILLDGSVDGGDLATMLRAEGRQIEREGKMHAISVGIPRWQGVQVILHRRWKAHGRRRAA